MAKLIQVIETEDRRGAGLDEDDPVRLVKQFWSSDGVLLMERDEWRDRRIPTALGAAKACRDEFVRAEPRLEIVKSGLARIIIVLTERAK